MPSRIIELSKRHMTSPEKVLLAPSDPSVSTLDQYFISTTYQDKLSSLKNILKKEHKDKGSTIIFCRTRNDSRRLVKELNYDSYNVVQLQGDLSQHQRNRSMKLFRSGQASILVATDIASRGIDVRHVDCVISLDVPENPLHYFHRIGRTARAGDNGKSYIFVTGRDVDDFKRIQNHTKTKIKPLNPDDEKILTSHSTDRSSGYNKRYSSGRQNNSQSRKYYRDSGSDRSSNRDSGSDRSSNFKKNYSPGRQKNSQTGRQHGKTSISSRSFTSPGNTATSNNSKINNTSNSIKRTSIRRKRWYK